MFDLDLKLSKAIAKYPVKTKMNLAQQEKAETTFSRAVLFIILIIAAAALISKFAVIDQYAAVGEAESSLSAMQLQLDDINTKLAGYSEVEDQYKMYSYGYLSSEEVALVDRIEVIDTIEQQLMTAATVSKVEMQDNVVTVSLSGVSLARVGELAGSIKTLPEVANVIVYTAVAETSDQAVDASMVITFQKLDDKGNPVVAEEETTSGEEA